MENRNGLVVDAQLTHATGRAEPQAALAMLGDVPGAARTTVGADKILCRRSRQPRCWWNMAAS
jgi:hypothetical protein